jgi:DNA-binding NtrC family response regulator
MPNERVLILENDAQEAHAIASALSGGGFRPEVGAGEGWHRQRIDEAGFDLLVLDMPRADLGPGRPFLILSGAAEIERAVEAARRHSAELLRRPFTAAEAILRAERVLQEHRRESRILDRLLESKMPFEDFEKELLTIALRRCQGNQSRTARLLGLTRRTLQYRIAKFGIETAALR